MASILLYLSTLLIVFLLTVLIETVALQLLRWGAFKQSLQTALIMNLASILVWFLLLALVPRMGLFGLVISFLLSTTIEALVLTRMKRGETGYNVLVALVVNLSSYLILLLPAFLYS